MFGLRPIWLVTASAQLLVGCSDEQRAYYPTYSDAVTAGAVQRGWIPDYVPRSAVEIHEAHNLDLNTQRLRFRVPADALDLVTAGMDPVKSMEFDLRALRLPSLADVWPEQLESAPKTEQGRFELFLIDGTNVTPRCIALERDSSLVYAWSC